MDENQELEQDEIMDEEQEPDEDETTDEEELDQDEMIQALMERYDEYLDRTPVEQLASDFGLWRVMYEAEEERLYDLSDDELMEEYEKEFPA